MQIALLPVMSREIALIAYPHLPNEVACRLYAGDPLSDLYIAAARARTRMWYDVVPSVIDDLTTCLRGNVLLSERYSKQLAKQSPETL